MKLQDIGEGGLVRLIQDIIGLKYPNLDNDVSYVDLPGIGLIAFKIDGGSFTRTKTDFMDYYDVGWRMTVGALADLAVKLSKPMAVVSSITMRGDHDVDELESLVRGIKDAADAFGSQYLGGDLNEGSDDVLDIAAIGLAEKPVGRSPKVGDVLVTLPKFGYTGMVFKLWYSGLLGSYMDNPVLRKAVDLTRRPEPWLPNIPSRARECIHASMDSSDGLGRVLYEMARNVKVTVYRLPMGSDVEETCLRLGISVEEAVFNGGEEYLPVFSIDPECLGEFRALGFIDFARVEEGSGVYLNNTPLRYRGWVYFMKQPYV